MRFILIHGAGQEPDAWDGVLAALPAHLRDIAETVSLTPTSKHDDYSFAHLRDRVRAAIDSASANPNDEDDRLVLVGQSAGADLALDYAASNPERVAAVIVADAHASMPAWAARSSRAGYRAIPARAVRALTGLSREQKLQLSDSTPSINSPRFAAIRARVTVIGGGNDLVERAGARRLRRALPGSTLIWVNHTVRNFNERHPRTFAEIIAAALPGLE